MQIGQEEEVEVEQIPEAVPTVTRPRSMMGGTTGLTMTVPQPPRVSQRVRTFQQMPFFEVIDEIRSQDEQAQQEGGEEPCTLGAVLEVDQRGLFIDAEVDRYPTTFLVDTGATRSTV